MFYAADGVRISGFWGYCPRALLGSAPVTHWGNSFPRSPLPTLPPNPGYATVNFITVVLVVVGSGGEVVVVSLYHEGHKP